MVIRDIVIPIVERMMGPTVDYPRYMGHMTPIVQDAHLEEFLEEMMRWHFGVVGANDCQHLREQLEEALRNDPYSFELLIKRLLEEYTKMATRLREAEKPKKSKNWSASSSTKKEEDAQYIR